MLAPCDRFIFLRTMAIRMDLSRDHIPRLTRLNLSTHLQESVMARPFSPSEAKAVVAKAQELLGDIEVISKATTFGPDSFRNAFAQAKTDTLNNELRQIKVADLQAPESTQRELAGWNINTAYDLYCRGESAGDDPHVRKLINQAIECADAIRELYHPNPQSGLMRDALFFAARYLKSSQLAESYGPAVQDARSVSEACNLVSHNSGRLRWLLLNAADKQTTEAAYQRLAQFVVASSSNFLSDGRRRAETILSMNTSTQLDSGLVTTAVRIISEDSGEDLFTAFAKPNRDEIEAAVYGAEDKMPKRTITKLIERRIRSEFQIREQVNEVRHADALRYVSEQSVDMLKDLVPGVRVKCIKDARYTTLGQIMYERGFRAEKQLMEGYRQSSRLSRINGISEGAADRIVEAIEQQVDILAKSGKIKLNPDNKKPEDTALLQAVYKHFELEKLINEAKTASERITEEFSELQDQIMPALDAYTWLFYKDRGTVYGAYEQLIELTNGAELKRINGLTECRLNEPDEKEVWRLFEDDPIRVYGLLEKLMPEAFSSTSNGYGLPEKLAQQIKTTSFDTTGLKCELRTYQSWGVRYILHQGNVLLGDEMGLGKTVQAIAAMVALKNRGAKKFLVVCPASVLENWVREVRKHSDLTCIKIHGSDRQLRAGTWLAGLDVGVTNYESTGSIELDPSRKLDLVVVDEAHYIKNPGAKRSINTLNLCKRAKRVLFMSGTPLENKVDEMIGLVSHLNKKAAVEADKNATRFRSAEFRDALAPVYYRRKREDVLSELPDLIENSEWCQMGPEELQMYYLTLRTRNSMRIRRLSWNVPNPNDSTKLERLREIVADAKDENRKVLVFSFFLDTIDVVRRAFGDACYGPISGSTPLNKRQQIIDSFDAAPAGSVLVAQIESGGTGLNIQSASVVVLCEPQYKPSIENQGISRAYRMGQSRNVLVYRLLCKDTVDERIMSILDSKQSDFNAFADKSTAAEVDLQNELEVKQEQLNAMFDEEIKRLESLMPSLAELDLPEE